MKAPERLDLPVTIKVGGNEIEVARFVYVLERTCEIECFDNGMDEAMDGDWVSYGPPTWHLSCSHKVHGFERPCYCAVCGRKVVSE